MTTDITWKIALRRGSIWRARRFEREQWIYERIVGYADASMTHAAAYAKEKSVFSGYGVTKMMSMVGRLLVPLACMALMVMPALAEDLPNPTGEVV